jgi:hypothetical protein
MYFMYIFLYFIYIQNNLYVHIYIYIIAGIEMTTSIIESFSIGKVHVVIDKSMVGKSCSFCGKMDRDMENGTVLMSCGGCKAARYCSKDW